MKRSDRHACTLGYISLLLLNPLTLELNHTNTKHHHTHSREAENMQVCKQLTPRGLWETRTQYVRIERENARWDPFNRIFNRHVTDKRCQPLSIQSWRHWAQLTKMVIMREFIANHSGINHYKRILKNENINTARRRFLSFGPLWNCEGYIAGDIIKIVTC